MKTSWLWWIREFYKRFPENYRKAKAMIAESDRWIDVSGIEDEARGQQVLQNCLTGAQKRVIRSVDNQIEWQSIRKVFSCPEIEAEAANIKIVSVAHGMGFTLEVDGKQIEKLRAVTLRLAIDEPNTVTVEFMPDFPYTRGRP